jgi:hypothetical protein
VPAVLVVVLGSALALWATRQRQEGVWVVEKDVEDIRDAPNGRKTGTLSEGAEVVRLGQDGNWVQFRMEGWIWGPSLAGFNRERDAEDRGPEAPPSPLRELLPRIRRLINDRYGVFYGLSLDRDLERLLVRIRVRELTREALERRQMAVQREVLAILDGQVSFSGIQVESNRPDGSGPVGSEIAVTTNEDIRRFGQGSPDEWRARTRRSSDGGATWAP